MQSAPLFPYKQYAHQYITPERVREMIEKLGEGRGYITGGYTAMVEEGECLVRTD